jgi:acyl transferase domain-containing protein/NAD(P)H-dependent flavin oxidoreductase YrpB (nitropropane dioxygenase family)/NADP-dependent 3-hydroxy acid dehydrogenase YdfG
MANFRFVSLSPIHLDHPGLALAAVRAEGVGLLDGELCPESQLPRARQHLQRLITDATAAQVAGGFGLRLAATQLMTHGGLLELLALHPHQIVLCGWTPQELPTWLAQLACEHRQIWLEIRSGEELQAVDAHLAFAGWLARGSECGGRSGRESAFILCQHLARQARPFWVQGGIGPHAAAACRVAGAAGVVLDDALLLLRESPVPLAWRALLKRLGVEDSAHVGQQWAEPFRFINRHDFPAGSALQRRAEEIADTIPEHEQALAWQQAVRQSVGWGDPAQYAWPLGQGAGRALAFAKRYGTVGKLARAIVDASAGQIQSAAQRQLFAPGAPLARAHGTRYPVVQGPMTRVSDRVAFAAAVAENGALPLLALALMRGPQVERLLKATRQALGERAWGIGILGFVPPELRQEQLAVIEQLRPPFALIAGGHPDQVAQLEALDIATYLHVPTPKLLHLFLRQGVRRFVFEGGECGGHVGPVNSFALWDSVIDYLLSTDLPTTEDQAVAVLFAGGIHDARSAAMIAAMAAPLAERNVRVGVLMGTAYLFTAEVVESGALVTPFQQQALDCHHTVTIETRPGHAIRCAPTRFTRTFEQQRMALRRQGLSPADIGEALEALVTGRLRIASKGLAHGLGKPHAVDTARQLTDGLYMMGELAALKTSPLRVAELHEDVSVGAAHLLAEHAKTLPRSIAADRDLRSRRRPRSTSPVAIVGIGCLLPDAQTPDTLWRNLLDQVHSIREMPPERWDWRLYYDPDPEARDKIYSKWGGFIDPLPFDPLHFGIPPTSLSSISLPQLLALEVTRRALWDAGYGDTIEDDQLRERTAVFFGASNTADVEQLYKARSALPLYLGNLSEDVGRRLPEWTEESYPGILVNIIAGRVANRFDLGGPNLTVDAACACSLAALDLAVRELETGRSDMVLTGGIELEQTPQAYMAFSKTRALSPQGKARVFDADADGIVISEGLVVLVLKRLADAERNGDRIYAVIQGVAGSSDGKGMGMTAPKPAGQRRALRRAFELAGLDTTQLGLYEAHATGTAVGDRSELEAMGKALRDDGAQPRTCVMGSAKSLLGHTRGAAGMVGLLKAAMALYHQTLPPHAGVERPLDALRHPDCPFYLLDTPRPWLSAPGQSRYAGVSAFGFGGTNFHAVLEEYRRDAAGSAPLGAAIWPAEIVAFAADDSHALITELERLEQAVTQIDRMPYHAIMPRDEAVCMRDLAFSCAVAARRDAPLRAAIVASSFDELRQAIVACKEQLPDGTKLPSNVYVGTATPSGTLAFLFPGQGAQYPGMGGELALYVPEIHQSFAHTDDLLRLPSEPLSRLILPPAAFSEVEHDRQRQILLDTRIAQLALATVSCGMYDFARRLGLSPARTAGHSFGEFMALHAAGVIDREALLRLSQARGGIMADLGPTAGSMAIVMLPHAELAPYVKDFPDVGIANHNAPRQHVLSGHAGQLDELLRRLQGDGHTVKPLAVSAAFHSALMHPAREPFAAFVDHLPIAEPRIPVHANGDGEPYPRDADAIRLRWVEHLEHKVDFVAQVESMYAAGVRTFLELGPGRVLTGLVKQILKGRPHLAVAADGGLRGWLNAMANLYVRGHEVEIEALFAGRPVRHVDLEHLPESTHRQAGWRIDGGRVWKVDEPGEPQQDVPRQDAVVPLDSMTTSSQPTSEPPPGSGHGDASQLQMLTQAYGEYQETMRRFLEQQERVMAQFLEHFGRPSGAETDVAPTPVAEQRFAAMAEAALSGVAPEQPNGLDARHRTQAPLDRQQLTRQLIAMVSQRTGYPSDMLDPDKDLEAELGIDSIKRIEILTGLQDLLPPDAAEQVQRQLDQLTRAKSLNNVVHILLSEITTTALDAAPLPPEATTSVAGLGASPANGAVQPEGECPRCLMQGTEKALRSPRPASLEGLYIVTDDGRGVAERVCDTLSQCGVQAHLIRREDLGDMAAVASQVQSLRQDYGPVRGTVHLAPLGCGAGHNTLDDWRRHTTIATKHFFYLLQLCLDDFRQCAEPPRVLAVSHLGGNWGRQGIAPGSPAAGGSHGLLRSLACEYPNILSKVVDFDETLSHETMAQRIVDELCSREDEHEIGYPEGRRTVFRAKSAPLTRAASPQDWRPRHGWVVLVTGGARGLTAELCSELSAPGVRLVVVGRSPALPVEPENAEPDVETWRQHLIDEAREWGDTLTPADIEARVRQKKLANERWQTLESLRQQGVEVEYHALDARCEDAFGDLIDSLYRRFGRLDAVLHSVGIIEDRRIEDKHRDSFERVFDTKADSTFILSRRLRPAGLKWVVLSSSVSGRFGNRGQADYAAANETVNRLACQMNAQWPATRVVSINWGPWSNTGMSNQGVQRLLEARGITPIEPAAGRRFFVEELTYGRKSEVEVVAGRGPWEPGPMTVAQSPYLSL